MKRNSVVSILFATSDSQEQTRFLDMTARRSLNYRLDFPDSLRTADALLSSAAFDIIITDLAFDGGAFADWLTLWPRPFILLTEYGQEERLRGLISDEACSFMVRDGAYRHIESLPIMIDKVLNVRESLDRSNAHLQISERRYMHLVGALPDIVYTLDGEGRFSYVNDSISLLGYEAHELIGKHFSEIVEEEDVPRVSREMVLRELAGKVTGPERAPKLFDERRSGDRMTRNLELRLKPKHPIGAAVARGTVFAFGEVSCVGFRMPEYTDGDLGTVGIIRDISDRKREEARLLENLRIKETLLKEIHHRIKNNLQVVSSLLNLQSGVISDPLSRSVFTDCQTQVQAIAMVHEQLYRSDDLQRVEMRPFIESLVGYLFHLYDVDEARIHHSVEVSSPALGIDQAIPIALIVNELVSNALKHGLAESEGAVAVSLERLPDNLLELKVRDSGTGLPADFRIDSSTTLGFQLVQALVSQIGGGLTWTSEDGAEFVMKFPIAAL